MERITDRILVVHNPNSSQTRHIRDRVMHPLLDETSTHQLDVYETPSANTENIIEDLAAMVGSYSIVLSAGGDGTAHTVLNALLLAEATEARLGALAYGNFNDMARSFNSRPVRQYPLRLIRQPTAELHPLDITVNDEHWRYGGLYATLGWTALAAARFSQPTIREQLLARRPTLAANLARIGLMYARDRPKDRLPAFHRVDKREADYVTDEIYVNGPYMAGIMRTGRALYHGDTLLHSELDVSRLMRNIPYLAASALGRMPGQEITDDTLYFDRPSTLPIQADGEYKQLRDVTTLSISKPADKSVKILSGRPAVD